MYRYGYGYSNQNDLVIYLILGIIVLVVVLVFHFFLSKEMSLVAEEKGYDRSKWFAWCFWTGLMGFIAVCAMPDKRLHELQSKNIFLLEKILSETKDNNKSGNEKTSDNPNTEQRKQNTPAVVNHPSETDNHQELKEKQKSQVVSQPEKARTSQSSDSQQQDKYQKAMSLWENGQKIEAEKILAEISGWKDATALLNKIRIEIADDAMKHQDFDTALSYYKKTGNQ